LATSERVYIGACGISCSACWLFIEGLCLPCCSGLKEDEEIARRKMEGQMKRMGHVCRKLTCVVEKRIGYCMRDCQEFPCDKYVKPDFSPYSKRFIDMHIRRRQLRV